MHLPASNLWLIHVWTNYTRMFLESGFCIGALVPFFPVEALRNAIRYVTTWPVHVLRFEASWLVSFQVCGCVFLQTCCTALLFLKTFFQVLALDPSRKCIMLLLLRVVLPCGSTMARLTYNGSPVSDVHAYFPTRKHIPFDNVYVMTLMMHACLCVCVIIVSRVKSYSKNAWSSHFGSNAENTFSHRSLLISIMSQLRAYEQDFILIQVAQSPILLIYTNVVAEWHDDSDHFPRHRQVCSCCQRHRWIPVRGCWSFFFSKFTSCALLVCCDFLTVVHDACLLMCF